MRIAILAPLEERVPPVMYGGIELVVFNLVEQLVRMGHHVTLFASGNSVTSGTLIPIFPKEIRSLPEVKDLELRKAYHLLSVAAISEHLARMRFDVVHNHIGISFLPFAKVIMQPTVITLHGALNGSYVQKLYSTYPNLNYVSISMSQRTPLPQLNYVGNVYNGIALELFPFYPEPKDYVAFLGRIAPEKGPEQAIRVAKAAGVRLVIAAKIDPVDTNFFRRRIKPHIDGKQIQFIGEVDHQKKVELLGNARALIAPVQWEEPFGLYFVEAMACGTPVIALNRGSVPEIIRNGSTGIVCRSLDEMADAVRRVHQLSRRITYDYIHTERLFSAETMAEGYVDVYTKIMKQTPRERKRAATPAKAV